MRVPTLVEVLRCIAPLALVALLGACDRAGELDSCVSTTDPAASSGSRIDMCPTSIFAKIDQSYRDIAGHVWAGENGAASSLHVEGSAGFGSTATFVPFDVMTDATGNYASVRDVPLSYDLTASFGDQILTTRGLGGRFFEPSLDDPFPSFAKNGTFVIRPPLGSVFASRVNLVLTEPVPAGKSLAFFTLGDTVELLSGDLARGLSFATTTYSAQTTLYVFAYDTGSDLSTVSSWGKAAVTLTSGGTSLATVTLAATDAPTPPSTTPVTVPTPILNVTGPAGYAFSSLDVLTIYSRVSRGYITSVRPGVAHRVPTFPDSLAISYRLLLASPDGAVIDSGIVGFAVTDPTTDIAVQDVLPPVVVAPDAGASVALTDAFLVTGPGVYEHTFAPTGTGSGPTIHVLTGDGEAHLPAFSGNAKVPHGTYTWTARSFPRSTQVSGVGGRDGRRQQASATAAPRAVVFP